MSAISSAQLAYAPANNGLRTPKSVEAEVLTRITNELRKLKSDNTPFAERAEIIHRNRAFWITAAADVVDPDNTLEVKLKVQILQLADYVSRNSRSVLDAKTSVDTFIEINASIIRGLSARIMADA